MKDPRNLSKEQLVRIVCAIRDHLYLKTVDWDELPELIAVKQYDPETEWNATTTDDIANVLFDYGLVPRKVLPVTAGYPKRTSSQIWKDDDIQFARLLDEIRAHGVPTNMMSDIESSMSLEAHQIEELFARATKRWEQIKKECVKGG
jgi:hypothetical protein